MRRAKTFHHLNSSYFESALIFCTVLFSVSPFSTPFTRTSSLLLSFRISFTRIPHLLLFPSHIVYSHPESALNLFVPRSPVSRICSYLFESRLPASRICSYSLRIQLTRIPYLLLFPSHLAYSHPVSALNLFVSRLPVPRICSYYLRISFTLIPHLLLSFTLYKNPVKCLNRLSLLRL